MKAKVTTEFSGRIDGEALARPIKVDEIIAGELAEVAVREGWAVAHDENVAEGEDSADLDAMTVDELKAFAAENGIDLGDATKKADIRAAIELAIE